MTDHGSTGKVDGFVERPSGVAVARSTVMQDGKGNGVYRVNWNAEVWKDNKILEKYREDGLGQLVYDHTMGVFEKALQAETGNGN